MGPEVLAYFALQNRGHFGRAAHDARAAVLIKKSSSRGEHSQGVCPYLQSAGTSSLERSNRPLQDLDCVLSVFLAVSARGRACGQCVGVFRPNPVSDPASSWMDGMDGQVDHRMAKDNLRRLDIVASGFRQGWFLCWQGSDSPR